MKRGIALVTGGGKGIGGACSSTLAEAGFDVAVHYNQSRDAAEELAASLPGAFTIQADISSVEGIEKIVAALGEKGTPVAVLVNNAGITRDNLIFSSSLKDFDDVVSSNMRSMWYLSKRIARLMMRQRAGRIINISSVIGHTGNPGQSLYGMTKAAIDNFTKSAAAEFGSYGILVNSVAPGFIDTDMTKSLPEEAKQNIISRVPLGRMGTPLEVAEVVRFLATSASYCSGSVVHVNGGMYGG